MAVSKDIQAAEVVLEAGGLVWKQTSEGPRIAVIHRHKYNDWSLPKGKVKEGEKFRDTAVREVKEETLCTVRLKDYAGSISYKQKNKIKVVLFWEMEVENEPEFQPTAEVDKIVWLTRSEALNKLSYYEQKQLLMVRRPGRRFPKLGLFRRLLVPKLRYERLAGSIQAFRIELDEKIEELKEAGNIPGMDAFQKALYAAETALNEGDVDTGWKILHTAQRLLIFYLNQDEIDARAELLRNEASKKLSGWRKDSIIELLPSANGDQPPKITKAALFEATRVRDDHSDNLYYKIALLQNEMGILSVVLIIALVALVLLAGLNHLPLDREVLTGNWETLVSVMLFGVLGGVVSGAFSLVRTSTDSKITELISSRLITLLRITVGAAAAVTVYALMKSAIFPKVFSFDIVSPGTVFFLAFVAGFTERLVIKAVSSVVGK
jgi:ADP-ribose pyrophosphatase YjhB (NUDIX family)